VFWAHVLHCRRSVQPHTSPAGNVALFIVIPSDTEGGFFFSFVADTKSKREFFLKTLWQNNAVLRRAALSAPKPGRTELDVRGI